MVSAVEFWVMKAVGFDFGETLIYYQGTPLSWKSLYPEALTFMARGCNYRATSACVDKASSISILEEYNTRLYPRITEVSSDVIIGKILESWGLSTAQHLGSATEHFFTFFQQQVAIYDDVLPVLEILKDRGLKTGILTDVPYGMKKEFVERDLSSVGILSHYLDVLLTSVDVGHRKPDPIGYIHLARKLGVKLDEMIYIGNEKKDIEGANAAGMHSALIARDGELHEWGQQHSIKSLHEIIQLI